MLMRSPSLAAAARTLFRAVPVHRLMRPFYGGIGAILVLHRVRPPSDRPRLTANARLEISPAFLGAVIDFVTAAGFDVISLDEAHARLRGRAGSRRFVCFTFDDGYADNHDFAWPIFRRRGLPFAVYVTTNFVSKRSVLWHYMLEDLLLRQDEIRCRIDGEDRVYRAVTGPEKEALFWRLGGMVISRPPDRWPEMFDALFDGNGIDPMRYHDETMSWEQVEALAADPLVTIGAHTVNHYNLALLDERRARWEIAESKRLLERRIGRPVNHFAYPFGKRAHAGAREFRLVRESGFHTATTTREGNLFAGHRDHLASLPRIEVTGRHQDLSLLDMRLSGVMALMRHGPRRLVTA